MLDAFKSASLVTCNLHNIFSIFAFIFCSYPNFVFLIFSPNWYRGSSSSLNYFEFLLILFYKVLIFFCFPD